MYGPTNPIFTAGNAYLVVTNIAGHSSGSTLNGLPLGTADGTATGEVGTKVLVIGATGSGGTVTTIPKGAPTLSNGQAALSTTSGAIVAPNATRRSVSIQNMDATITIYVGTGTVSASNGYRLLAGQSVSLDTVAAVNGIAASGTPSAGYIQTAD